jgi:hypothetical protein
MWVQIAVLIVSALITYATQPRPKPAKRAAFSDFEFPQADEGTPQAVIFGDCWTDDWMVLGVGNYRSTPIRK